MKQEFYEERVNRYRILRHEELPESMKAERRLNGIDPDDMWSLIWSFETEEAAQKCLDEYNETPSKFWTHKMVDAGQAEVIKRPVW